MDKAPVIVLVISLLSLLVVIAFSSGTEVAMLSVNRYRIRSRVAAGERGARLLEQLLSRPDQWLGANLVILALASVAASTIATLLALRVGHRLALPFMMGALTVVIIVFCELAPKIYAALHAERVALGSTYIYRALLWVTYPVLWVTNYVANGFLRLLGVTGQAHGAHALTAEELRSVVTEASPLLPPRHRQMLLSILDLERITVNDIMIPRHEIAAIDVSVPFDEIMDRLRQSPHTRLPVYDGELDHLIGILHMKRVAQELARGELTRERLIEVARAREPYFVPEGTSLTTQLGAFQRDRRRQAFVVNEYGDIEGLVTLEDLLEEIVGEFTTDPATVAHRDAHRDAAGNWLVNASATIRALNRSLGWQLPIEGPRTLNGLLLEKLETIPEPGTALRIGRYEMEILQIADNSVRTVRVHVLPERPAEDA
ncbi:MAG TPA: CNNM domain-containing protein [Steroidobacteraceae bacterium]|nr:CNNM domain-containing protein [Steroidobacteraceae bacterium]